MLIATIPAPHTRRAKQVAEIPGIDAFRFNTGVSVPNHHMALVELLKFVPDKPLWVDLKCRQLRVAAWADPEFSEVTLNRDIRVSTPATIIFRGGHQATITHAEGNKLYLADPLDTCVGAGQSVNIFARELKVLGPLLTYLDKKYLKSCAQLGITRVMASFIETWNDVDEIIKEFPGEIYLKIENQKGVYNLVNEPGHMHQRVHLELARDDLSVELPPEDVLLVTSWVIEQDPGALVASRFFKDLQQTGKVSVTDLEDLVYLRKLGYKNFMFQDGLSEDWTVLQKATQYFVRSNVWANTL
jgi:hypothetical protein